MQVFSKNLLMAIKESGINQFVCTQSDSFLLLGNGDLYGCGNNQYGQLGSYTQYYTFTKIASNVAKVACSQQTTWYIDTNGDLYGCGAGNYGQQGSGSTTSRVFVFTKRASNVKDIYVTEFCNDRIFYVNNDNQLYGCGHSVYSEFGNDNYHINYTTFTKFADNVDFVLPLSDATWYIATNGDLYGCGENSYGQQGNGTANWNSPVGTFTKRASNVVQVSAQQTAVWYLDSNGDLYGCGANQYGQQGNNSTSNVTTFTKRASNVKQVAASNETTWYVTNNGDLYGCGNAEYGQQGNNSTSNVTTFTKRASNVEKVVAGGWVTWYITTTGDLYSCGYNYYGNMGSGSATTSSPYGLKTFGKRASNVSDVFIGNNDTTFYLDTNGDLYGCGYNNSGQQGNGSTNNQLTFENKMQYLT